ncbi:tRNA (adenosine(37)-N6)-threonylcarbamoyltransferase complex transferase subunit TsaD [Hymenobacter weizhouensis]|uniref:tRNA (adenosine(37)-N6)-threonylcarbamoyltransferase complex transferase subunit TsaD n=1 Tax=Hymenobacter sp. YIM 151500-1 TaxID=2987689 RepID=UPI002226E2BC|nr:tRNA (adenosine(37)-N6)-threonylcarbamoyltransferase complex transferase subunit TsaD [Hymenobacter sp. YIM 151500-1]UYZ63359.1 tRNA (adenosine(37)-N6)-threonylcarbamoyltransferase complex transferase subunit TsaD [Hymenobacter sp. YIM 151500-1]
MHPIILAIESSCDDTSAAVMVGGEIRSNVVATQQVHEQYGGVVPELASRAHQQHLIPVVEAALQRAGVTKKDLDAVAFTQGPGLLGSLLVGGMFAKTLALALSKPLIAVNHMRAHILAHFIEDPRPTFPFLCLTVSGGHTQLVVVRSALDMEIIGQTIDDAAGEAFDKTAKLLGLPYPGGPHLDKLARQGNPTRFAFPVGAMPGYDFSFSGLKTAVLYFLKKETAQNPDFVQQNLADLCASIQHTIIQTLLRQLRRAAHDQGLTQVALAGGVAANSGLRQALQDEAQSQGWQVFIPAFQFCTDNAGMVAMTAHFQYQAGDFADQLVSSDPRLKLG